MPPATIVVVLDVLEGGDGLVVEAVYWMEASWEVQPMVVENTGQAACNTNQIIQLQAARDDGRLWVNGGLL